MAEKITKTEAKKVIENWFALSRVDKAKEWNKILPYINAHKNAYLEVIEERKQSKTKENNNGI